MMWESEQPLPYPIAPFFSSPLTFSLALPSFPCWFSTLFKALTFGMRTLILFSRALMVLLNWPNLQYQRQDNITPPQSKSINAHNITELALPSENCAQIMVLKSGHILLIQLMKNQDFQLRLLVRQNNEMAIKLQSYRRQNQQLVRKNQNLNCWVQNLCDVFSSISASWRVITDNEEAFYSLIRKKNDVNSKNMINKYVAHFKAFEDIINNLGEKITNQGHSENAAIEAKTRLASFVNNYNLFFTELVDSYFRFNDEYLAFISEKADAPNLQQFMRNLMSKELQNRQKIKQFDSYFIQFRENLKTYEGYYQHKLLDGIVLLKNQEVESLKEQNSKLSRKVACIVDYNPQNIAKILQQENIYECYCGGVHMQYLSKMWEQNLKKKNSAEASKVQSDVIVEEGEQDMKIKVKQMQQLQSQKGLLMQRNIQCLSKLEKIKIQNKISEDAILSSAAFGSLKGQFNDLLDYTNILLGKLNKSYQYLHQIQKARLQQIQQLRRKYERPSIIKQNQHEVSILIDNKFLDNFKEVVIRQMHSISSSYHSLCKQGKQKQDKLTQAKELMKNLKRENDELNRRLGDLQERATKSVQSLQYRHAKFNQVEQKINQMFRKQHGGQDLQRIKKVWEEYVQYVKTRDKKIKAMQDQIRKKQKQIQQKNKLQQVLKSALAETQAIYTQTKERVDKFDQFAKKIEKQIINLSEQNYKAKIQSQQQKNFLTIRLKNQQQVKNKLQQRLKQLQKIDNEVKLVKQKQVIIEQRLKQLQEKEKEELRRVKVQLLQRQRRLQENNQMIQEKDKVIQKIIAQKQKKNLQIGKLRMKLKAIQQKTQFQVIKLQMQQYKKKIMCSCGAQRQRELALKTCPHIFCKKCLEDTVGNRNRKCPICNIKFSKTDVHEICWA